MFEFLVPFLIASSDSPAIGDVTSTSDKTAHATRQLDLDSLADGLRVVLDERGLTATRSEGASTFTVSLLTRAIGREGHIRRLESAAVTRTADAHVRELGGVSEWYRPCETGLEHGWTIHARADGPESDPTWIFLEFGGDLTPRIAEDGSAAWLVDCEAQLRMRYDGLKAWDADGNALDARLASCPTGVGVRIQDAGARYPITIDPVLSGPPLILTGTPGHSGFGEFVTTAGDVNGDGYSDVLVSEIYYDNGQQDEGRVVLYLGSAGGLSTSIAWQVEGQISFGYLGQGVGPAGDVNNDGFDDVLVGHSYATVGGCGADCGEVTLYLGSSTGLALSPAWTWNAGQAGAQTGFACATAGDVNGDGHDDVLIGVRLFDSPSFVDDGAAYLFFGTGTGDLGQSPAWSAFGGESQAMFGSSVATAGDLDADGYADIAVGAPGDSPTDRGRVWVYRGSITGPVTPAIQLDPVPVGSSYSYGQSVSCAGDVNGDGFADLCVGAPTGDNGINNCGQFYVHLGRSFASGTLDPAPAFTISGGQTDGRLGQSVAAAGDVDGDGFADLVYGEPAHPVSAPGNAYILSGHPTTFTTQTIITGVTGDALGKSVATAGDVNGDGFSDVLIGSPGFNSGQGRVHLFYGQPKPDSTVFERTYDGGSPGALAGRAIAMGDVDGDAYADLVVGEPAYTNTLASQGRVRLYRGTAAGVSAAASWTFQGTSAGMQVGCSIAFLNDVDGDGFGDVLVGAKGASNVEAGEGHVLLFRGSASGLALSPQVFESNEAGAELGASVSAAGDVNGDGLADAVAGAPGVHAGSADAGALHLFLGRRSPPGLAVAAGFPISPGISGVRYGHAVAGVGDLNADGLSDVAVGAPAFTNGQTGEGAVYVYRGAPGGLILVPSVVLEGNTPSAEFGYSVSSTGDVNGDSFADMLVGAPGWESATKGGFAFVYRGQSGTTIVNTTTLHAIQFNQPNARTGHAVAFAGDINGDGFADAAIGSPFWDQSSVDGGRVGIFFGSGAALNGASQLPPSSAAASTPGDDLISGPGAASAQVGYAMAGAADLHGHGYSDFAAGAPGAGTGAGGQAYFFMAGGGTTACRPASQMRSFNDQGALELLGMSETSNSFGLDQSIQQFYAGGGSPGLHAGTPAGREVYSVVWEVELLGTNFDAAGLGSLPWTDSGINVPVAGPVFAAVTVPQANENYHWRTRFRLRNPYFPHTRWFSLQGTSMSEKKVGTAKDCDGDGTSDGIEIATMQEMDCNGNMIPDNCDLAPIGSMPDCNGNGSPDSCDLFFGDCNNNQIPDECELPPYCPTQACDCNGNMVIDACDVSPGGMPDSNGDLVPDSCQTNGIASFCAGDGSGTPCPCGNVGGSGRGCGNSLFGNGAHLGWSGVPRLSADNFTLLGTSMPNSSALYFQGTGQQNGGLGTAFGDGLRCSSGSVIRLGTKLNSANVSQYGYPGDLAISVRGNITAAGTRTYQCWYRNAAAFCTVSTFNLTNGLSVTWIP